MLIDMHVHTIGGSSCSIVSLEAVVRILIRKGFNGVLVTDHQSDTGYSNYFINNEINRNFCVLRGFENINQPW